MHKATLLTPMLNRLRHLKSKLVPKNPHVTAVVTGRLKLLVGNDLAWAFSSGDYYEKNVIHFLDRLVKSYHQPILIDVGANCGFYSTRYAAQCKNVFSFEPVKSTFSLLKGNIKRNGIRNALVFNLGLSNTPGQLSINIYNSSGNNSIFERKIPEEHSLKKIGVELIKLDTLDNLLENGVVSPPDIIKIDVEGAELLVLRGAAKTILKHRPTIVMEYSENTSNDAGYVKEELLTALELYDYSIFGIPEDEQDLALIGQANFATHKIGNVIFVPRERNLFFS